MRARDLATLLMVKAFEDQDPHGTLLPLADRAGASREAARTAGNASRERLLVERARLLHARLVVRYPVIEGVRSFTRGIGMLEVLLLLVALVAGFGLSALDGPRRIEIFSLPLLALLAWNLVIYLWLALRALPARRAAKRPGLLAAALSGVPARLTSRVIARSRAFDTALAAALERFTASWFETAKPANRARAARAIHLAAAAIGLGLVGGLYLRGLVLDYHAGWESTFLTADRARSAVALLYGPAAALTGIPLPDAPRLEAMRWPRGERAPHWIHWIAATVLLYIVVPRLLLAMKGALQAWRHGLRMPLTPELEAYFRRAFAGVESVVPREVAVVIPYAHSLGAAALARLIAWMTSEAGGRLEVQAAEPLPYGEEDTFLAGLAERAARATLVVLPFGLASTPEDENHGKVIEGTRDWLAASRPGARLLVVIDEAAYRERMAGAPERVAERREVWRAFVQARGLEPAFVELGQ